MICPSFSQVQVTRAAIDRPCNCPRCGDVRLRIARAAREDEKSNISRVSWGVDAAAGDPVAHVHKQLMIRIDGCQGMVFLRLNLSVVACFKGPFGDVFVSRRPREDGPNQRITVMQAKALPICILQRVI